MHYVYILKNRAFPSQLYFGITSDLKTRFGDHNAGKSPPTSKYRPWNLICYTAIADKATAISFEKYLKSHSGRAFARKHLISKTAEEFTATVQKIFDT